MNHSQKVVICALALVMSAVAQSSAGNRVTLVSEERLKQLLPGTVFIDGENVPTQERNAVLAQLGNNKLFLVSLIDTAGYSSAYQEKYSGAILAQTGFTLGSKSLEAGAYAIGQKKSGDSVTLYVYNLGGDQLAAITAEKGDNLRPVKPLQIVVADDGSARLYLGSYYVSLAGR